MIIYQQNYTMRFQMFCCEDMRKNTWVVCIYTFQDQSFQRLGKYIKKKAGRTLECAVPFQ